MFEHKAKLILVLLLCALPFEAIAQVSTVQALNFGNWISKNNDSQHDITINTDGSFSFDSAGFIQISAPTEGVYDITTANINTAVTSVVVAQNDALLGAGGTINMVNFQEQHSATSDGAGVVRVIVGATARTTGNGSAYNDTTRNGSIDITINF